MKNDFFKSILLSGGSRQNRTEIENETLPVTFSGSGHRLRNYRIYGNTVERKNLFDKSQLSKSILDDDGSEVSLVSWECTSFIDVLNIDNVTVSWESDSPYFQSRVAFYDSELSFLSVRTIAINQTYSTTIAIPVSCKYIKFAYSQIVNNVQANRHNIQIEKGSTATEYEPYIENTSVGDLQENGKYFVPVTVSGKNLLKNTAKSKTVNGVTFTVNDDSSVAVNGTAQSLIFFIVGRFYLPQGNYFFSGCPDNGSFQTFSSSIRITSGNTYLPEDNNKNAINSNDVPLLVSDSAAEELNYSIRIEQGTICDNLTFYPMIRLATVTDNTYEPYHEPQTVNIELDEPLGEGEYIDFREQKRYPSGETISLPVIPTIDGTNIITVDTETQPSKIWLQGNISEIETVSAQSLQANIQDLEPLSLDDEDPELDVMTIEKPDLQPNDVSEAQLDVMPVEIPVQLNEISPTIGGVEDGE